MNDELEKDFPSLKLGYEQVQDSLRDQAEITRDYANRAITLFSIAIAILGIAMPILFLKLSSRNLWELFSLIPIIIFVFIYLYFWKIYRMKPVKIMINPESIINRYIEVEPQRFYSNMIQHINSAFKENEIIIQQREKDIILLATFTLLEAVTVVILTILFFYFGLL